MKYTKSGNPTPETDALLVSALALAADGVKVFPCHGVDEDGHCTCAELSCKSPGKHPRTWKDSAGVAHKNGAKDATTDEDEIRMWWTKWGQHGRLNIGQTLAGRAVVDIDVADGKQGMATWETLLEGAPENPDEGHTLTYRTGRGGTQYVFRLPEGEQGGKADGYGNKLGEAVDFKTGPNAYVMVPGSKTQSVYTVVVEMDAALLPEWIADLARTATTSTITTGDGKTHTTKLSHLSALLSMAPDDPRRGNDWLAQVAGHFAKMCRDKKDLYLVLTGMANADSTDPIGDADFTKTIESIWGTEQAKKATAGDPSGWLLGCGDHLEIPCYEADGSETLLHPYSDFDIKVLGLIDEEEHGKRAYDVIVTRQADGAELRRVLTSDVLADARKWTGWLYSMGVSVNEPVRALPSGGMPERTRFLRYLESQKAPLSRTVEQLGWHPMHQQFVTATGIIRPGATAIETFAGVRPSTEAVQSGDIPFSYGFAAGGRDEVREVLAEVLTYHDEETLVAFASWCLTVIVKSAIKPRVAQFPFFAIEAASGSGKTTGAIAMIGQLIGYAMGDAQATQADFRNKLARTRSCFVHLDDLDDASGLTEIIRIASGEGTRTKRSADVDRSRADKLTGALLITGEHLGFASQKALNDRMIMTTLSNPKDRKSQKPGRENVPQYEDLIEMRKRYPQGLTTLAGTVVAEVLTLVDHIPDMVSALKPSTGGRKADLHAVVRTGARLLDWLLADEQDRPGALEGQGRYAALMDAWTAAQAASGTKEWDDALTLEMLPWAVRQFEDESDLDYKHIALKHFPAKVRDPETDEKQKGALLYGPEESVIYFHGPSLADAWAAYKGWSKGKDSARVNTAEAVARQARAAGFDARKVRFVGRSPVSYWIVSGEQAAIIMERAFGPDEV